METAEDEDAAGLMVVMTDAFAHLGIVNFESKLAAAGMDRASINMGIYPHGSSFERSCSLASSCPLF